MATIRGLFDPYNNADTISGTINDDFINGYGGADTLSGGDGNDTLYGNYLPGKEGKFIDFVRPVGTDISKDGGDKCRWPQRRVHRPLR